MAVNLPLIIPKAGGTVLFLAFLCARINVPPMDRFGVLVVAAAVKVPLRSCSSSPWP